MSLTKASYSMITGAPVNVLDYGASPSASASVNRAAIQAAIDAADYIYIPQGTYQIDATLICYGKKKIIGAGTNSTIIVRNNATAQTIDGNTVYSVFYLTSRYNCLESIGIEGDATVQGVVLTAGTTIEPASNGSLRNVKIESCGQGIVGREMYMFMFDNVICRFCINSGFDFSSALPKTSLTFNSCWAENCEVPWDFTQTVYSTLNSCGADAANSANQDYSFGVYTFRSCTMTLNGTGCEFCFGAAVYWIKDSRITLNNPYWVTQQSTYDGGVSFSLAPIVTSEENCTVTVNSTAFGSYSNAVHTGTIGQCVACNYSEVTYGAKTNAMVTLTSSLVPADLAFVGSGASKYCTYDYVQHAIVGQWTPTVTATSGTITLDSTLDSAYYVRTGNQVFVQGTIKVSSVSMPTGQLKIGNLPFVMATLIEGSEQVVSAFAIVGLSSSVNQVFGKAFDAQTDIYVFSTNGATDSDIASLVQANTTISFGFTYTTTY